MRCPGPAFMVVVLLGRVGAGAARAEKPPGAHVDPDTEIARRHFEKGTTLYNDGKYEEAVAEFVAARRVKPLPAFDYKVARCYDRLERVAEAIDGYERYLAAIPPTEADAAEIRARVAVLKQRVAESAPLQPVPAAATSAPPAAPPATPPPARRRLYTWIVGGAGAALLAGSLAAGLVAHNRYGSLKDNCAADGACDSASVPDAQNWIDSGRSAGVASDVLLGIGAAAVVAGVALYFVEGRSPTAQPERRTGWRITPTADAHGGGILFEVAR